MKLISLKIKNYKKFTDKNFLFNSTKKQNTTLITGENASGKTTILDSILWCLYENKNPHEIIPNNEHNGSTDVQVEIVAEDNKKQYQITRIQKFYSAKEFENSAVEVKYTDGENSHLLFGEDAQKVISKILPEYIVKYQICNPEKYRHLCRESAKVLPEFIKSLMNDKSLVLNYTSDEIFNFLNEYFSEFLINMHERGECLKKVYIDEEYNFHMLTHNNVDFRGCYLTNTGLCTYCSLALIFIMIKVYEKVSNRELFIVIESPYHPNPEDYIKFSTVLLSQFSQIINVSDNHLSSYCDTSFMQEYVSDEYSLEN